MILLYKLFTYFYKDKQKQLFSIHDCFGTTCDKVSVLKTILASVYTDLYSSKQYLIKFDKDILDSIETQTDYKLDRVRRIIKVGDKTYKLKDID
jgi:hypothetical protein